MLGESPISLKKLMFPERNFVLSKPGISYLLSRINALMQARISAPAGAVTEK